MLTELTEDGTLEWECKVLDEDGVLLSCGSICSTTIDKVQYIGDHVGTSAVIALPKCQCGAQTFLKADYTLKELWKATLAVKNAEGVIWAYVLPLRYTRSLLLHHMLYTLGMCESTPVLAQPPNKHSIQNNRDLTASLWFGIMSVRSFTTQIGERGDG